MSRKAPKRDRPAPTMDTGRPNCRRLAVESVAAMEDSLQGEIVGAIMVGAGEVRQRCPSQSKFEEPLNHRDTEDTEVRRDTLRVSASSVSLWLSGFLRMGSPCVAVCPCFSPPIYLAAPGPAHPPQAFHIPEQAPLQPKESTFPHDRSHLALGGKTILPGLSGGHVVYHWIVQSFVVLLPEIQAAFSLSAVGVGGLVTAREIAAGLVALPGGVATDLVRRYWGRLLAACLLASGLGAIVMGVSPVYLLLLAGIAVLAAAHPIWHLAASGSLSYHYTRRRGTALSLHGVGGSIGDVAGPLATGALLLFLTWREIINIYAAFPLVLGLLAIWAFRNIGHTSEQPESADVSGRVRATGGLLRSPVLWGLTAVRGFRAMALAALVTILPLYLSNDLGMNEWSRGFHIGLLIAVGLVAKTGAGYLSDRWGRKQVLVQLPYGSRLALPVIAGREVATSCTSRYRV